MGQLVVLRVLLHPGSPDPLLVPAVSERGIVQYAAQMSSHHCLNNTFGDRVVSSGMGEASGPFLARSHVNQE